MLTAFHQSLSHIIEVDQKLVSSNKSSETDSKSYPSSFENNMLTEDKPSDDHSQSETVSSSKSHSASNSSIKTFIDDKVDGDIIEDPPIIYSEAAVQEISNSSARLAMIVQHNISVDKEENPLSEVSVNIVDNNASMLMEKSSEINSCERKLNKRMRGQLAWLELQKQKFRKEGQVEKVLAMKKQQKAILLESRENHERTQNEKLERIFQQREESDVDSNASRRAQVDHLRQKEADLLLDTKNLLTNKSNLNDSLKMIKSIDKSMKILEKIKPSHEDDTVKVSGAELNKLWKRLSGLELCQLKEEYHLTKQNIAEFYGNAKKIVLNNNLRLLIETSKALKTESSEAYDSTLNSIETEDEFPGSFQIETEIFSNTENDDDLHKVMTNQMKVFLDHKKLSSASVETTSVTSTKIENSTFRIRENSSDDVDESFSSFEVSIIDPDDNALMKNEKIDNSNQLINDLSFSKLEISEIADVENNINQRDQETKNLSTITERSEYDQSQASSEEFISENISQRSTNVDLSDPITSEIEKRLISISESMEEVNKAFRQNKLSVINPSQSSFSYSTDKDFVDTESSHRQTNL